MISGGLVGYREEKYIVDNKNVTTGYGGIGNVVIAEGRLIRRAGIGNGGLDWFAGIGAGGSPRPD